MRVASLTPTDTLYSEYLRIVLSGTGVTFALYWFLHGSFFSGGYLLVAAGLVLTLLAAVPCRNQPAAIGLRLLIALSMLAGCLLFGLDAAPVRHAGQPTLWMFSLSALSVYLLLLGLWHVYWLLQYTAERQGTDYETSELPVGSLESPPERPAVETDAACRVARSHAAWTRRCVGWAIIVGLLVYMVVVPAALSLQQTFADTPASYNLGEESWSERMRIRSAKIAVFAIFVYVGASLGSFLNVVAESLPAGQPIALRGSSCPQCGVAIKRIDNLPIFSYLLLGGRCRACSSPIPIRYLFTELIGAGLFAAFFLGQLVTGAANLPGFTQYSYTGIVWIILYTKWDVVGITAFHLMLFCTVMTAAFAQAGGRRLPLRFWLPALGLAVGLPTIFPDLMPLKLHSHLRGWLPWPDLIAGFVSSLAGLSVALVAASLLGWLFRAFAATPPAVEANFVETNALAGPSPESRDQPASIGPSGEAPQPEQTEAAALPPHRQPPTDALWWSMLVLGAGLGWQAVAGIALLCLPAGAMMWWVPAARRQLTRLGPVALLLLIAIVHQLIWKSWHHWSGPVWPV